MRAVVYNTNTGQLERQFEGPASAVDNQALGSDEAVLTENEVSNWPQSLENREVDPSTEIFRWKLTLSEAQNQRIQEVKEDAQDVLSKTDWFVMRQQETGETIPQDVLDHRSKVRAQSDVFEQEINDLGTVEEVMDYSYEFPGPPR